MPPTESSASEDGEKSALNNLQIALKVFSLVKTAIDTDSVRSHKRAVLKMCCLKERLQSGNDELVKDVAQVLLSAGAIATKAILFFSKSDDVEDFKTTATLLFILLILCKTCEPIQSDDDKAMFMKKLQDYGEYSIGSNNENFVRHDVAAHCMLRIWSTPELLSELGNVEEAAIQFFRATSSAMFLGKFLSASDVDDDGGDFCSLNVGDFLSDANPELKEKQLKGIVDGADSEAGQTVLRDLILSFLLPRELIGVRTTLQLPRDASKRAGEEHGLILARAHDAAMRGAPYSYAEDEDEVHQACALLSGFAMLQLAKEKNTDVRAAAPFSGLLQIFFLEAKPRDGKKIFYDEEETQWSVYSRNEDSQLQIHTRGKNLSGLKSCILEML